MFSLVVLPMIGASVDYYYNKSVGVGALAGLAAGIAGLGLNQVNSSVVATLLPEMRRGG